VVIGLAGNSLTGTNSVTALLGDSAASVATRVGVSGGTFADCIVLLACNPRVFHARFSVGLVGDSAVLRMTSNLALERTAARIRSPRPLTANVSPTSHAPEASRVAAALVVTCTACAEQQEASYADLAAADRAGAIQRGWIPDWLPKSARGLREVHNVDTNQSMLAFRYDVSGQLTVPNNCSQVLPSEVALIPFAMSCGRATSRRARAGPIVTPFSCAGELTHSSRCRLPKGRPFIGVREAG